MKNYNYEAILVMVFFFVNISTNAFELRKEFKEYEITAMEDF